MVFQFLLSESAYRLFLFFDRWYRCWSVSYWSRVLDLVESLDRTFAVRVHIRYWLVPLFGDYTVVGRIIAFPVRTFFIVFGSILYLAVFAIAFLLWSIWVLIPFYILFRIARG
jgi:hypothetical protein